MSATLEKLRTILPQGSQETGHGIAMTQTSHASSPASGESSNLEEQLVALYEDLDYLTQHFPAHNVRSLVDYTKSLQQKLSTQGGATSAVGFVPADIASRLEHLTAQEADQCNFGVVEIDDQGRIIIYNRWESELAGVSQEVAIGCNFFLEIAPCTNNRLFLGRFKQGVQTGTLDTGFNYTFTYKMKPTHVQVHMYRQPTTGRNFIFVKRRD